LTKDPLIYSVSHFTSGGLELFLGGAKPTKAYRRDGTDYQQTTISKTVLSNHAMWYTA